MTDIFAEFRALTTRKNLGAPYEHNLVCPPYNRSDTLFTIAGIQHYSYMFNENYPVTICSRQACLRFNDIAELNLPYKSLYFRMLGLFSFRHWTMQQVIDFWMDYLRVLHIKPDYVTIHHDKPEWSELYSKYDVPIQFDNTCEWSDGVNGGYCTEFFKDGLEIGNVVNPKENCYDCGFGLERLDAVVNRTPPQTKLEKLISAADIMTASGYVPGPNKQGYYLRRVFREIIKMGGDVDTPLFKQEVERQQKVIEKYNNLKDKHPDQTVEWWWQTHGVDVELINA